MKKNGKTETQVDKTPDIERQVTHTVSKLPSLAINRYWVLLGLAVFLLLAGAGLCIAWFSTPFSVASQVFGGATLLTVGSGLYLLRRQIRNRHDRYGGSMVTIRQVSGDAVTPTQVKKNGYANSLCIYPDKLIFDNVNQPGGQPQKLLNDGKYYHVLIWNKVKQLLEPFILPDSHYTDPSILARYLGLPAQRKYLRNRESLMRFAAPGLLLLGNIGAFITMIALSN